MRDISKKLGKDVSPEIEGEDTEADKNGIEALAAPLIQILFNSHGPWHRAARGAARRESMGRVVWSGWLRVRRLTASSSTSGTTVRGDAQRVPDKAVVRGVIPGDKAQTLSDADAVQLTFLPGFSTEQLSDLSSRGVGMDVLRNAVKRINGQGPWSPPGWQRHGDSPVTAAVHDRDQIDSAWRPFDEPMDLSLKKHAALEGGGDCRRCGSVAELAQESPASCRKSSKVPTLECLGPSGPVGHASQAPR